jgi:steroid delta-isomerase-like uncharacterized protein
MKHAEIEMILTDWLEAWHRRDAAALTAAFAEKTTYTSMLAGTIRLHSEIEALYRSWFTAFPDMVFKVERRIVNDDQAAVHWSQSGTHVGEFCGLAGTGRIFYISGAFFMTFRDGRIESMHSIYDFTGLLLQIGLLKAKPVE